jgi:4'-phosphopantetheinyl transferase
MSAAGPRLVTVAVARPDSTGRFDALLAPRELERAAAFRNPAERARFATGRALLRALLAAQTGGRPDDVELDDRCPGCGRPHGKPRAIGLTERLHTSVSHAGDRVLVALCDRPVGIDVEPVAATKFDSFEDIALTAAERIELARLPAADRAKAAADAWVQKEAILKRHEFGLDRSPDEIQLGLGGGDRVIFDPVRPATPLAFVEVAVGASYRAWLAMTAPALPRVDLISGEEMLAAAAADVRPATR